MMGLPDVGAILSDDRTRRYWLGRKLGDGTNRLLIIGCNPSTADETANDPTIKKEMKPATRLGFAYLDKCNLFDWRATNPRELWHMDEPASSVNEAYILAAAARCSMVICAWGKNGALDAHGSRTRRLLLNAGAPLYCLRLNKDGSPAHPLYIPDSVDPQPWSMTPAAPRDGA